MIWFTSDLHFAHKNIVRFTQRGKETTQAQHDEWLVCRLNEYVRPEDTLYHIGDLSFARDREQTARILDQIVCNNIILFKGNHDRMSDLLWLKDGAQVKSVEMYREIKIRENPTVLFHFPIASWHKQGYGSWHLHGHCHANLKEQFSQGKILDVGIDNAFKLYGKHRPFSEEDIERYMHSRPIFISDHHGENL